LETQDENEEEKIVDVIEQEQLTFRQALDHWYYRAKYRAMVDWIRSTGLNTHTARVGDFGCGAGLFLSLLVRGSVFSKENLLGIDSAYQKEELLAESGVRVVPSLENQNEFDLFLLMDVLEHIEDDRGALNLVLRHCRPGGYLFVTVPAMEWLWSGHDFYLGHKRRYTVNSLTQLFHFEPDLEIIGVHYFYASILPVAIPLRLLRRGQKERVGSDMRPASRPLSAFLKAVLKMESCLMRSNRIAGLTVMALCRKRTEI
jgi:2-polyprenyl-3-methyl-5-hydroxy-6-metoxy-1,4-benzoquinol methylase